jgi:hypothetical protein
MEEILKKLIERLVLPKYPIIKDFAITEVNRKVGIHNYEAKNFYSVHYFVVDDLNYENNRKIKEDITSDTVKLFKALGIEKYDVHESVMFASYQVNKMVNSLEKLIGNVMPPKYPWIKNFEVFGNEDFGENFYTIHYYVDENEYKKKNSSEINRIISETRNLYSSLGPSENDFLKDISFENYGEWFKN